MEKTPNPEPGKEPPLAPDEKMRRDALLGRLEEIITYLHGRGTAARFRGRDNDRVRLAVLRVEVQAITSAAAILKDRDLDGLLARVEALEIQEERWHLKTGLRKGS